MLEKRQVAESVSAVITAMHNGTWLSPQLSSGKSYEAKGERRALSYGRFLRRNVSTEVEEELAKFQRLLVEDNASFAGMAEGVEPTSRLLGEDEYDYEMEV